MVPVTGDVDVACRSLRRGGLVGLPTETVYGLAADATDAGAIARVFEVKGRPADHPLILHIADAGWLAHWVLEIPQAAARLADAYWPGPMTLLLTRNDRVLDAVTGGRDTVAVRVPAHPLAAEVLRRFAGPLVAPSANRFGHVSPTTAAHVLDDLGGRLDPDRDVVLAGGPSTIGVESTIVDCTGRSPQVLRHGAITQEQVAAIAGFVAPSSGPARAPGMLARHYSPRCDVVLTDHRTDAQRLAAELERAGRRVDVLDEPDLVIYARTLFARLRAADRNGIDVVVAVLPPAEGLGHAIRDRLARASAGR
ncbi:MAG: L-threonylcarbamoyladenylate synthase [Actinomycetota bacterium]|nr:L-threonylcarbamoyladenylate synthase [Actinomycetota bacterium]